MKNIEKFNTLRKIIGLEGVCRLLCETNPYLVKYWIDYINQKIQEHGLMENQVVLLTDLRNPATIRCGDFGRLAQEYALKCLGVPSQYANIAGIDQLKLYFSEYLRTTLGVTVDKRYCIPTNGRTQAIITALMIGYHTNDKPICFIDCADDYKKQLQILQIPYYENIPYETINSDDEKKLGKRLSKFGSIVFRLPEYKGHELDEGKLEFISKLAEEKGIIIIEDKGYEWLSPEIDYNNKTIARWNGKFILLYSLSLAFNCPGERLGMLILSENFAKSHYQNLFNFCGQKMVETAVLFAAQAPQTSGPAHSAQWFGVGALKALLDGSYCDHGFDKKATILGNYLAQQGFLVKNEGITLLIDHPKYNYKEIREILLANFIYTDPISNGKIKISPLLLTWLSLTNLITKEIKF